jgi:hypothetical protein
LIPSKFFIIEELLIEFPISKYDETASSNKLHPAVLTLSIADLLNFIFVRLTERKFNQMILDDEELRRDQVEVAEVTKDAICAASSQRKDDEGVGENE